MPHPPANIPRRSPRREPIAFRRCASALVVVLLLAIAPDTNDALGDSATHDAAPADPAQADPTPHPQRAWLAEACAPLRWTADGEPVAEPRPEAFTPHEVDVLAEVDGGLRVRLHTRQAALEVWLPAACFAPVVRRDLEFGLGPSRASLTLLGGQLAPCRPDPGAAGCTFRTARVPDLALYLPADRVGLTGRSTHATDPVAFGSEVDAVDDHVLRLAPDAEAALAVGDPLVDRFVETRAAATDGWVAVTVFDGGLWRLYARAEDVRPYAWLGVGVLARIAWVPDPSALDRWVDVREGAPLRAGRGGERVGRVGWSTWFEATGRHRAWTAVRVVVPGWADAPVWVRSRRVSDLAAQ